MLGEQSELSTGGLTLPYQINGEDFATKDDIRSRCRSILARTPDGMEVAEADFLYGL